MADDEYEAPSPTQAELNSMNRAVFGIAEEKPAKGKENTEEAETEEKSAEGEKPVSYKTRQAKAD